MTATTTLTKTCIDCERPMRPTNANPDYWPDDAVAIGDKGRCNSCTRRTCAHVDCDNPTYSRGVCHYHHLRLLRTGASKTAKPCLHCGRPMRPIRAKATDWPGTILTGAGGYCSTCYSHRHTFGTDGDLGLDPRGSWVPNGRGVLVWHGPETRTA